MAQASAPVRSFFVLLLFGVLLATLGLVVRSQIFMRKNPGRPMSAAMRETLDPEINQLTADQERQIAEQFPGARLNKSGLRQIVRAPGTGSAPQPGQTVTMHCSGRLLDGTPFYNSRQDGAGAPLTFVVGANPRPARIPAGWEESLLTMKKGEKRTLILPWWLAYGAAGSPPAIPPRTPLVFELELLDIQ